MIHLLFLFFGFFLIVYLLSRLVKGLLHLVVVELWKLLNELDSTVSLYSATCIFTLCEIEIIIA